MVVGVAWGHVFEIKCNSRCSTGPRTEGNCRSFLAVAVPGLPTANVELGDRSADSPR